MSWLLKLSICKLLVYNAVIDVKSLVFQVCATFARLFNSGESQSFPGKSCFFSSFIAKVILLYCRVKNEIMKRNEQGK